ncbi:MAG: hypothetical protein D5R99_03540 [Methanocalculus sp. MSAO_Arc1]|nr:MAG: hypothetical protein D5R99_03540 [Methanocalculus sp. MSAO_Arc1]
MDTGRSLTSRSHTKRADRLRSDDGLSEVIGFILIIAIIMIFLSLWMVYVVPAEGRQQEIEHMNYVRNWFTQYKITADSLWVNHDDDTKELTGMTFSNSIVLGSQGAATQAGGLFLPVMSPVGSTGAIEVVSVAAEGGGVERIRISNGVDSIEESLVRLEFISNNNYWVQQSYYYQMGGVFLRQQTGTVARIAPLISFYDIGQDRIRADIVFLKIDAGGQSGISGQGPVRVDTTLRNVIDEEILPSPPGAEPVIELILSDNNAAKGWRNILKERGAPDPVLANNVITIDLDEDDEIQFRYANFSISKQSVATLVD